MSMLMLYDYVIGASELTLFCNVGNTFLSLLEKVCYESSNRGLLC